MRDAWEANASLWTEWARRPGHDSYWRFHRDAFLALVPAPGALTLDVGSGEGRVARDLAGLGHRVVAIEPSPTLAREARAAGGGLTGVVRADSAALPFAGGAADLVVAFMALHDMDDMAAAVADIGRVLRPGGMLCAAVVHPLNSAGTFRDDEFVLRDSYFQERRYQDDVDQGGLRMRFVAHHRPLEAYFAAMQRAGLLTEAVREVRPGNGDQWDRVPLFLDFRAVRA
jgi:SAM-dependent methyltransferase